MKKGLLFALALGIGTFAIGQNKIMKISNDHYEIPTQIKKIDLSKNDLPGPIRKSTSNKGAVTGHNIGYSNNIYTALVDEQTAIDYNSDLGLISYTHRAKIGENGATGSGDILVSTSIDNGATWNTELFLKDASIHKNRYPTGVIYNPAANTDIANAYIVYSGPSHNNGNWDFNYFGSGKFDSTNISNAYVPSEGAFIRNSMEVTSDGKVHIIGTTTLENPIAHDSTFVMTGTFNSTTNSFDWTTYKFHNDFHLKADGNVDGISWYWQSAFSADGTIGYIWTIGRDLNEAYPYLPIVWKSTDSGANWNKMPQFDPATITNLTNYLPPVKGESTARPLIFTDIDGVVDVNNNLHLVANVLAASNNRSDSLNYYYSMSTNPILDFYTTSSGWDVAKLGDINTVDVPKEESGFGTGADAQGWDCRLQASRTDDGSKIFASWTDSDTLMAPVNGDGFKINMFPDLKVAGLDVITGTLTEAVNFTFGTAYEGVFFYHYMSSITSSDNGTYTLHISHIDKGIDPANPVTHIYMEGIEFTNADFVIHPSFETSINNSIKVSQNRPNPFSGNTQIDVNLDKASNLSIEVINITGQTVYSMDLGRKASGTHTINLNSNNLAGGIYFYTVTAGNSQVTKKMIVR